MTVTGVVGEPTTLGRFYGGDVTVETTATLSVANLGWFGAASFDLDGGATFDGRRFVRPEPVPEPETPRAPTLEDRIAALEAKADVAIARG
jgi:hypothetical protein